MLYENNFTMKCLNLSESVEVWFDTVYQHVYNAIVTRIGYSQNKSALMPFDLFFGKLVECCWHDRFILEKRYCTQPDFKAYLNNSDGGVDLKVDSKNVSVKCRGLIYNKDAYFDNGSIKFNRQYIDTENIIKSLIVNNKCDFIVGAVRYKTPLYGDWMTVWNNKSVEQLIQITKDIVETQMIWFSTENGNIQIEI